MSKTEVFIGDQPAYFESGAIEGKLIDFDNEKYYTFLYEYCE